MGIKKLKIDENGILREYDVLFTIKDEDSNKEHIVESKLEMKVKVR